MTPGGSALVAEQAAARADGSGSEAVPALELEGLAHRFGRRWALRGVSLRVQPGEVVALVGANGSGKTTLLRAAATALRPTRGGGRVFGRDLIDQPDRVRERIGYLGHACGLYDDLTAAENLSFAQRMAGRAADRAALERALEGVGLGRVAGERVRSFSAGMRRRAALARLILLEPSLLLLDEPYASVDRGGVGSVNALLRRVRKRGGAALVATHGPERARGVLDRVIELEAGRVAARHRSAAEPKEEEPFAATGRGAVPGRTA